MLEAQLNEASILKKVLDSIKELVTDANFECNDEGINLQAMDNSHVALVSVKLERVGFANYRCDRPIPLGVNLNSLTKVLKCAKDDDMCTIKASEEADVLNLVYEAKSSDRIAEYDMKLMDIDSDQLGIPDTEYDAQVTMASSEFARIVRDLSQLGESVRIEVSKEGIRFASDGESANGSVLLKHSADAPPGKDEEDEEEKDSEDEEDEDEDGEKKEKKAKVKKEKDAEDVDMENGDGDEEYADKEKGSDDEEDEEDSSSKKRKKKATKSKPSKKAKKDKKKKEKIKEEPEMQGVNIQLNQLVSLTFSLKYLVNFSKSSNLAKNVRLLMSSDVPLLVNYEFGQGHIRYYLAPKIGDE
ncbi:proliferating cell nuclear antigen [Schizophyllum commune H4-8]|uniref:DNA sliding clamp PCNA n=1 Tax=Schizophyllum commune (strain H4-8 / FGSC 9210) TaxID=578458 RepID=D8Q827_SCHCM|nr:proliferating cell nuclear antigen [Schizophyllum commune H4-8]KAI5891239.1 proliferating cell nuclear antigen [Schizophyllum commune H4-8]